MDWHRLFGLLLTDFFTDSPFSVELERDLSLVRQYLDVVILRKGEGRFAGRLPDGLDDLAAFNLITFKSHQQPLTDWALKELIGHYVSYRKLVSPSPDELLPEEQFRLYAVCSRYPHNLAGAVKFEAVRPGVYHCPWSTDRIRVVVVRHLPEAAHNAPLHLFSGSTKQVAYGAAHYRQRSESTSTLLDQLFERYQGEGVAMPYTMEDFRRDYVLEHFRELTPSQKRKALEGLPLEERLEGLSPQQIENYLKGRRKATASKEAKKGRRGSRRRRKS